jgi:hypothetical protein
MKTRSGAVNSGNKSEKFMEEVDLDEEYTLCSLSIWRKSRPGEENSFWKPSRNDEKGDDKKCFVLVFLNNLIN